MKLNTMKISHILATDSAFPEKLLTISEPPKGLYCLGDLDAALGGPVLAVVGSRKVTPYGRQITEKLVREAAKQGITIVSGLALGVDSLAHQAALTERARTVAVMPCGLDKIYPSSHRQLAEDILKSGGALVSEYPAGTEPFPTNFVARNRIVAGLADAVLITEAAIKSGTLHTANFALDQGKTVMAVPGNITSEQSAGTNNLIKSGAIPVTEIRDILSAMGLERATRKVAKPLGDTEEETLILGLLFTGVSDASELLHKAELAPHIFNQSLTMLEIQGKIKPLGAGHWSLA
jgi:DNA processing protein